MVHRTSLYRTVDGKLIQGYQVLTKEDLDEQRKRVLTSPKISYLSYLVDSFLLFVAIVLFKNRTYVVHTNGTKYLLRTYLKMPSKLFPFEILLHKFYAPDQDRFHHNHPWIKSHSLILSGGYIEERLQLPGPITYGPDKNGHTWTPKIPIDKYKTYKPGRVNTIHADDYHTIRCLLNERYCWTLFIAGKRTGKGWGFWDPIKQYHIPWKDYTEAHNNVIYDVDGNVTKLPF